MPKKFYIIRNDDNVNGIPFRTKNAVIKYIKENLGIKVTNSMLDTSNHFDDVLNTSIEIARFYEDQNY